MESSQSYRTQSCDTSYAAEQYLIERWRMMTDQQKFEWLGQLFQFCRELAEVEIRERHPQADPRVIRRQLAERQYGVDVARRAFG